MFEDVIIVICFIKTKRLQINLYYERKRNSIKFYTTGVWDM